MRGGGGASSSSSSSSSKSLSSWCKLCAGMLLVVLIAANLLAVLSGDNNNDTALAPVTPTAQPLKLAEVKQELEVLAAQLAETQRQGLRPLRTDIGAIAANIDKLSADVATVAAAQQRAPAPQGLSSCPECPAAQACPPQQPCPACPQQPAPQLQQLPTASIDFSAGSTKYKDAFAIKEAFRAKMERYKGMYRDAAAGNAANYKWIRVDPSGQLCNRIRILLSGFLIGLLTDRLVVCTNFGYGETKFLDLFEDPGFDFWSAGVGGAAARGGRRLALDDPEVMTCKDIRDLPDQAVSILGAYYAGSVLQKNPYLQRELAELFHDDDYARPILAYVFQPRADIISQAQAFAAQTRGAAPLFVTYHLRSEFPVSPPEWKGYRDCTRAVIPKFIPPSNHGTDVATFVATDSVPMRDEVTANLGTAAGGLKNPTYFSPDVFHKGSKRLGLQNALIDVLVASYGDHIFLSPFSSFSRMIMLYAPSRNVYLVTDNVMPERDPHFKLEAMDGIEHCYKFYSKEPCGWNGHLKSMTQRLKESSCWTPSMQIEYC
mmetsp:Transcript_27257/g.85821  ORF Transcript_27257/g.85821 Transcript_27257/m.85821 type:complete len:545 (-) Transcript_27257:210-1844(-)